MSFVQSTIVVVTIYRYCDPVIGLYERELRINQFLELLVGE